MCKICLGMKSEQFRLLERDLDYYDKILLFPDLEILYEFSRSKAVRHTDKRILVLSEAQIFQEIGNVTFRHLTVEEVQKFTRIYLTYEFSDRFFLIAKENANYASLFNFVDTGILSMEEVFEVLTG